MTPQFDQGSLLYFEHVSRYIFASQFIKGKSVVDVATGSGYGAYMLSTLGTKKVIGIDNSKDAIDYAKKTYKGRGLKYVLSDALALPFNNESFDVCVSFETIEHLKNQEYFIKEVKRVLKRNGLLILSTPNKTIYPKGNIFHTKEFTPWGLEKLLRHNFKNVRLLFQNNVFANYILERSSLIKLLKEGLKTSNWRNLSLRVAKLFNRIPAQNTYIIALAANNFIPKVIETSSFFKPGEPDKITEQFNKLSSEVETKRRQIRQIRSSRGWKIVSYLHELRLKIPFLKDK